MNAVDQYEVWFVTGAQLLYGGDAVIAVDAHSNEMVNGLNESGKLPVKVVYKGTGKVIADEGNGYQWEEKDDKMTSCAIYFRFPETEEATETSYNGQNMGSVLQGLLGYLLPCILKDITLEPDGNIIANYSGDAFNEENKDLFIGNVLTAFLNMDIEDQDMITDAIKDYQYTTSPKGLAYWFQRDGKIVIKLDLPAIISQVASGSGKVIDSYIKSVFDIYETQERDNHTEYKYLGKEVVLLPYDNDNKFVVIGS